MEKRFVMLHTSTENIKNPTFDSLVIHIEIYRNVHAHIESLNLLRVLCDPAWQVNPFPMRSTVYCTLHLQI